MHQAVRRAEGPPEWEVLPRDTDRSRESAKARSHQVARCPQSSKTNANLSMVPDQKLAPWAREKVTVRQGCRT